ncbi:hypothetical protein HCAG_04071 [Paecilomyces variotii No. 5]|uniref:U6 snRNA-associated Sm-like protein LSm6 n=1 Tax=Byssochlamys spectabilis (strain No. 5 / NBRC 109023) TaxID=1356009 RepID=V5I600_BYSSN|nr:hypothetical protein HCAG_04071 [Paecilomyces variotii No. 5]
MFFVFYCASTEQEVSPAESDEDSRLLMSSWSCWNRNRSIYQPYSQERAQSSPYLTASRSSSMENGSSSEGKDPSAFLSEIIGAPVTVKLNSGVVYKGELQSVDGYMNIALEKTEEYIDGKLRRSYGDAFSFTFRATRDELLQGFSHDPQRIGPTRYRLRQKRFVTTT